MEEFHFSIRQVEKNTGGNRPRIMATFDQRHSSRSCGFLPFKCWSSLNLQDGCDTFYFCNSLWEKHPIIFIHFPSLLLMVIRISTRTMLGRIDPLQASLQDTMNRKIEGWEKRKQARKGVGKRLHWDDGAERNPSLNSWILTCLCTHIQLVLLKICCFESL